jgi:hypothetical protein
MLAAVLLPQIYAVPLALHRDIGSEWISAEGLYSPERNADLSYSYTDGDATLAFPESGTGSFAVELRLGGPGATVPVEAALETPNEQLSLGDVSELRVYHVLSTSDALGDLDVQAHSTTASLPDEDRQLGVLLDWVAVRSLGRLEPPLAVDVLTPLILLMVAATVVYAVPTMRRRVVLLGMATLLLGATYAVGRGLVTPGLWWTLGLSMSVAAVGAHAVAHQHHWTATRRVVVYWLLWRATLWVVGAIGLWYSAEVWALGSNITHHGEQYSRDRWFWNAFVEGWSRWDALHYQSIASSGYTFHGDRFPTIAFFPLYPMLSRALGYVVGDFQIATLIVSNGAFLAALLLLQRLLRMDFGDEIAERTVLLLMIFPTAFFWSAAYSEALALLLVMASLWALRAQRWWLAGLFGALLTLTRIPGIMMAPLIVLAYGQAIGWNWRRVRAPVLAAALPPLALLGFMAYQWLDFGTPFAFLLAQRAWKNQLSFPWVIPTTLIHEIMTAFDRELKVWEFTVWASFIVLVGVALRRLPFPYGLASLLLLMPVYLSSFPGSIARQVLIAFPAFVVIAQIPSRTARRCIAGVMFALLVLGTLLFVNGFWVG